MTKQSSECLERHVKIPMSQNTKMEGDNDNAAGFRMHSIGKEPMFATCGEIHWRIIAGSFGVYKTLIFDWSVLEHKHRGTEYSLMCWIPLSMLPGVSSCSLLVYSQLGGKLEFHGFYTYDQNESFDVFHSPPEKQKY